MRASWASIAIWVAWAATVAISALFTLLIAAFAGDDPARRKTAEKVIAVAMISLGLAAFASQQIIVRRGRWWEIAVALAVAAAPPFVTFGVISILFRKR